MSWHELPREDLTQGIPLAPLRRKWRVQKAIFIVGNAALTVAIVAGMHAVGLA